MTSDHNVALVDLFQNRMKVDRIPRIDIIRISFTSRDPETAYYMTRTLVNEYIDHHIQVRKMSAGGIGSFLYEQLDVYYNKLTESERALRSFKEKQGVTVLDKQTEELLSRYTEAEVLYNTTRAENGSKERRLAYLTHKISEERSELVLSLTNISSPRAQNLKRKLVDLEPQYTELQLQKYAADHPLIVQTKERIDQTKASLISEAKKLSQGEGLLDVFSQVRSYLEESIRLQIELEAIKAKELQLKNTLDSYNEALIDFPAKEMRLARLTRERNVNEQTYLILVSKRDEAKISEAEGKSTARIIDEAEIPDSPVWPRKKLNVLIGLLLGGLFGIAMGFLLDAQKRVVESSADAKAITGWSVIATVPKSRLLNGKRTRALLKRKTGNNDPTAMQLPSDSAEAEAYRILVRNILLLVQKEIAILITSSGPEEGKSKTAANLAVTLANMDQNTLLVISDIIAPLVIDLRILSFTTSPVRLPIPDLTPSIRCISSSAASASYLQLSTRLSCLHRFPF